MPRVCTVCNHKQREAIDKALLVDEPYRHIASRFGTSTGALQRHRAEHLPATMIKAQEQEDVRHAIDVLAQLKAINGATLAILKEARDDKNGELALKAVDRIQRQLELQAKLLGELAQEGTINITLAPEWLSLRAVIVQAIEPYPAARKAVLEALN